MNVTRAYATGRPVSLAHTERPMEMFGRPMRYSRYSHAAGITVNGSTVSVPDDIVSGQPWECPHDDTDYEPADWAVGVMTSRRLCNDCGEDVTDDPRFEPDYEGDAADRAYDAWRDERDWDYPL